MRDHLPGQPTSEEATRSKFISSQNQGILTPARFKLAHGQSEDGRFFSELSLGLDGRVQQERL